MSPYLNMLYFYQVAEQQDGSSDDFQEQPNSDEKGVLKGRYSMDNAMEDKICDLYDLYVEVLKLCVNSSGSSILNFILIP